VDLVALAIAAPLAAGAFALAPRLRHGEMAFIPALVPGISLAVAVVGLQLVPLPPSLLRALSPAADAILYDTLAPVGLYPAWRPLTLDPGATALELAKAAVFTAVCATAAVLGASERRRDQLLRGLVLSGVAVVAVCYGATLLGLSPLVAPTVTFVNPNHLAGFLQLAAWPALGFALRARGPARAGWLLAFAFTISGVFLSLSRAGIAAFFVAAGIFVVLRLRARSLFNSAAVSLPIRPGRTGGRVVAAGGIAAALAIASWLALDPILAELRTVGDESSTSVKLGLWAAAARLIREFPLVGIGRGAFETVFPAYKSEPLQRTFTHVENEWLQLPAELGLVVGLAVIALFAWAFLAAARSRDLSRPMAGALAGAGALALHNLFDFSLELPGVAIPFALVLGLASRAMPRLEVRPWLVRTGAALALVVAAGGLLAHSTRASRGDPAVVSTAPTADEAVMRARAALDVHPADYIPHAAVGVKLAAEDRCAEALRWLTRAMLRNPTAPEAHRATAWCLARTGREALAKREYRLAFLYGDGSALGEALRRFSRPGELLEIAPDTSSGLMAAGYLLRERPAEAAEAWRRAWESFGEPVALAQLASVRLAVDDKEEALRLARLLQERAPRSASGYIIAARALDALGRSDDAIRELELGAARLPGEAEILAPLGSRHLLQKRFSQAKAIFDGIVATEGPADTRKRILVARALEGQGRYQEALREAQVAREVTPGDLAALDTFARIAAAVGRYDEAIDAIEHASRVPAVKPGAYEARLEALRRAREEQREQRLIQGLAR